MRTITTEQVQALQQKERDLAIVNTLPRGYFDETKIPGAVSIPFDEEEFLAKVEEVAGGKDHKVIVYCANAECDLSERAARELETAGFTEVMDYAGGAQAWKKEAEGHSPSE